MKTNNISDAQTEVWKWKDKAAAEVENIDLIKALEISINNSISIMKKLGLKTTTHKYIEAETFNLAVSDNVSEYNPEKE